MMSSPCVTRHKGEVINGQALPCDYARLNECIVGSEKLKYALGQHFHRWEIENNFRPGAGEVLVPAGWRP